VSGVPTVVVRCDSAGATHRFAQACRDKGVGFSFGFPVDAASKTPWVTLDLGQGWYPAIDAGGDLRDGVQVAEATALVTLSNWPAGTRLILRKEGPHPGGRNCGSPTPTGCGSPRSSPTPRPGQCPGNWPVWNCVTASTPASRTAAKAAGLVNLPCHDFDSNAAWLEIVLTATDLVAWAKLIGFTHTPELARAEIAAFR
jgi:hypothetical protein